MADALKIALILTAVDKASAVFDKAGKKMNASLKGLDKSKAAFNKYGNYAVIAGAAVAASFIPAIHAAEENEVSVRKLEQVYRSMGQNVEQASKQSQEYASKLQLQIGVEDEVIMAVQTKLATFKQISDETARMNGHFDRATTLAFDMAATGFGEASGNAVQLGKALNDPVKGITALNKAGIQFTAAEKKRIASLVASNKVTEAQSLILTAIEKQVGGVSKAQATATDKARVAWSEVTESLGKALLPTFTRIIEKLTEIIPRIQAWIEKNSTLIKWIAGISVAVLALGVAMKVIAFGITGIQMAGKALGVVSKILMANPIILIITAIAAAAYLIYTYWDEIVAYFTGLWNDVKAIFSAVWAWIKKIFWDNNPYVLIYKNWGKIVTWFKNLWEKVKQTFLAWVSWLGSLPGMLLQKGINIVNSIWNGMKLTWPLVKAWFKASVKGLYDQGGAAMDMLNAYKEFDKSIKLNVNASQSSQNGTGGYGATASNSSVYSPVRKSNSIQYAPVITVNGGATQADADLVNSTTQKGFDKMMQQYNNNKQRTGF